MTEKRVKEKENEKIVFIKFFPKSLLKENFIILFL